MSLFGSIEMLSNVADPSPEPVQVRQATEREQAWHETDATYILPDLDCSAGTSMHVQLSGQCRCRTRRLVWVKYSGVEEEGPTGCVEVKTNYGGRESAISDRRTSR